MVATNKNTGQSRSRSQRNTSLVQFMIVLVIVLVSNIIGGFVFTRFDLTSEKRFTLSPATKDILRNLDDYVTFRVYLEGEFPAGFKNLRRETKEMLNEFRAYSKYINYEFINPSESTNKSERDEMFKILVDRGLTPTDLQVRTNEGTQQKVIFPGALVMYRDKELSVDLLENQINTPPEMALNNSVQNLEFKLADVIKKLSQFKKPSVAFIEGHGELNENELFDITKTLEKNYRVERISINGQVGVLTKRSDPDAQGNIKVLTNFDAIVIAKPSKLFDEKDKFIIDQYIMYGGKVLWLIDPVIASMDSLQLNESTVGISRDLNLDDQLFTYGVRLNKALVLDLNAAAIPLRTGQSGGQAQIEFFKWHYFPLLTEASQHPVSRNINSIKSEFVSPVDTIAVRGIRKTALLQTSGYSRITPTPALITLAMLREKTDSRLYTKTGQKVAWLLEGSFESLYKDRINPQIAESKEVAFKQNGLPAAMIVVADGDIIRNQFHIPQGYPLPLGFDQYTRQTFGNKDFILNAINYLTDGSGLISIRSRELKIRLLDGKKVADNRVFWQIINTAIPVITVILFGIILAWFRKKRYSK
ncbi:MAG: gliding motility-associated ABC transporter substrate-binding protein GldG [Bacteroidales bacterium]|nr:gliding motility-associated ABC transporter substrate-binding protein GldG [Bacteroidales bacterium]